MSCTKWPEDVRFENVVIAPDEDARTCKYCGGYRYIYDSRKRYLKTLGPPLCVMTAGTRCPDPKCAGHKDRNVSSRSASAIAPPFWTVTWELFAWMGHRRFARHWSVPQIRAELLDTYNVEVSCDLIEDYTAKYEVMTAAREGDLERLVAAYSDAPYVDLTIDGLQPEKGHETLYVVRELVKQRVWFAEPLLSSATFEVQRLFERAGQIALRIGKPVRCWMSDKQEAFVKGVAVVFPGVPHRYCQNHFMRDVAKQTLEKDSHAKVQMRRKVRGLRNIEREMLRATTADGPKDVVLDYCSAVRGILNDDQGGPLSPPGVRMAEALSEVLESIDKATSGRPKGGAANRRSSRSPVA